MTNKKENLRLLISLGLAGIMVAGILWLISKLSPPNTKENGLNQISAPVSTSPPVSILPLVQNKPSFMSLGTRILVEVQTSPEKIAGVKAFDEKDFITAVEKFTASLKDKPNDPETLIYLNNAKIAQDNSQALKVAIIAPISFDIYLAQEILRGVAQAQDEVNKQGGINGKKLQIVIASVDNPKDSGRLDEELVQDKSLVAVVGVRPNPGIYNEKGLVLVFPVELPIKAENTSKNNYLFHVNPLYENLVNAHAQYIAEQGKNIAICGDIPSSSNNPTSSFNPKLVEQYTEALQKYGSKIINIPCNFADKSLDPRAFVDKAIETENASGFLLIPSVDNIPFATKVAQEVKSRKPLFASEIMYSPKTLANGKYLEGMVLPVYWHRDAYKDNPFAENASRLWNGEVNQRTAGAYDALQVIITGLKQDNTREGLQKVLSNPDFLAHGATQDITFSPLGERKRKAMLVKIESCERCSNTGYRFTLLK